MKKFFRKLLHFLDELSYFIPDLFLAIFILSFFVNIGEYDLIVRISLLISYLGTSYGEYMYHKIKTLRDFGDEHLVRVLQDFEDRINKELNDRVSYEGLIAYADFIQEEVNDSLDDWLEELKGELMSEMERKEAEEEVQ